MATYGHEGGGWMNEDQRDSQRPPKPQRRLEDMSEPELADLLRAFGSAIKRTGIEAGIGRPQFVLLLFNDPALCQYIASIERDGAIKALRETADRLERRQTVERVSFPQSE